MPIGTSIQGAAVRLSAGPMGQPLVDWCKNLLTDCRRILKGSAEPPTHCVFWEQPEKLRDQALWDQFELIEVFENTSHWWRRLLKCRECGQLYFFEFMEIEFIDWEIGAEPIYCTYIPVYTRRDIERLKQSNSLFFLQHYPRLQDDFPAGAEAPTISWCTKPHRSWL